jgi:hypothetical protein
MASLSSPTATVILAYKHRLPEGNHDSHLLCKSGVPLVEATKRFDIYQDRKNGVGCQAERHCLLTYSSGAY